MKKLLVTLLAASMCLAMLAGCGSSDDSSTASTSGSGTTTETSGSDTSEPSGDVELRDFTILGDATSTYYDENEDMEDFPAFQAFRQMCADKGVNLVMEYVADDQYQTTLQTRFNSLTDVPMYASMYRMTETEVMTLAQQGIVLDLNPIMEAGDGTAKAFFNENQFGAEAKKKVQTVDGEMFWMPNIYISHYVENTDPTLVTDPMDDGDFNSGTNFTVGIRQDWLTDVGMEIPTTTEEFKAALQAFNEADPSGSGVAAGMHVYSYDPTAWGDSIAQWFGLVRGIVGADWEAKTTISPWHQETALDYLTYINDLSNAGLFDPEMVGNDNDTLRNKVANNQVGAMSIYALASTYEPLIENLFTGDPEDPESPVYVDIFPIEAVEGVTPLLALEDPVYIWDEFVITNQVTDNELAAAFMDVYYSDEHIDVINWGVEGTNYEVIDGEKHWLLYQGKEGGDKQFKADMLNDYLQEKADQRLSYGKILYSRYITADMSYYDLWQSTNTCREQGWAEQKADYQDATIDYGHWTSIDVTGTLATASVEETELVESFYNDLTSTSEESFSGLVLGTRSLDEFDSIVETLDSIGLTQMEGVYQARYDRFVGE